MNARNVLTVSVCLLWLLGTACSQPAVDRGAPAAGERYQKVPASSEGIGKSHLGRHIAYVMGWQGAAWLERGEREREERPDLLLPILALEPAMVVADIGAGTGYYTRRMADLVGPTGKVYAADVQPEMIEMLKSLAGKSGYRNIEPVLSAVDDVRLPAASVDLAIMVDVYHELEYPYEVLSSLVRAVKPGGRIVFVEYRAEDPNVPIKALHKMSEAQIRREAEQHALTWQRTAGDLPWQHVVVFTRE